MGKQVASVGSGVMLWQNDGWGSGEIIPNPHWECERGRQIQSSWVWNLNIGWAVEGIGGIRIPVSISREIRAMDDPMVLVATSVIRIAIEEVLSYQGGMVCLSAQSFKREREEDHEGED